MNTDTDTNTIDYRDTAPDAAAFKALYDSTGWGDRPVEDFERALAGSWAQCAAWRGGQLLGFARVISDGCLHAYINEMIVLPEAQGLGIGRELMLRLLARCHAQGIRDIQLFAAAGKSGFYRGLGFELRPEQAPGMQFRGPDRSTPR
jgi:ribosomal protein S18 acetylase RimI-like enzyme